MDICLWLMAHTTRAEYERFCAKRGRYGVLSVGPFMTRRTES